MIIATGPTGSGKTTTLYALINLLRQRPISIVTIEDPVEYFIPGIRQIPVNMHAGFGFADALRSILRQDPDVIMVGEIRDAETARLAASAALTGHLVLCTLHASQGSGAFARLTDLGVEPYVVNATVSLVIAQRLLRKLCQTCRRTKTLTATEHAELLHRFGTYQPIAKEQFEPRGCAACRDGYLGRAGAYELIRMDEPVRESLRRGHGLEEAVRSQRVETIERHAVNKACAGMTSFDEVLRLAYA